MKKAPDIMTSHFHRARRPCVRRALGVLGLALVTLVAGCGVLGSPPPKPRTLDDTYGQLYSKEAYDKCVQKSAYDGRCLRYILRRTNNPEFWPYPDVPPMKWPDPPSKPVYREGMTSIEYFAALCKEEAGEFIYRTVKVDGIYQIRPRKRETGYAMEDRYVVEDPYGTTFGEEAPYVPFAYVASKADWTRNLPGYSYFETRRHPEVERPGFDGDGSLLAKEPPGKPYQRYFGMRDKKPRTMQMVWSADLKSLVGFTWRGIRREKDRQLNVAGGELAVVDLRTNEVLGIRRGFILGGRLPNGGVSWYGDLVCPSYLNDGGPGQILSRSKHYDFGLWFLTKVAIPSGAEHEE